MIQWFRLDIWYNTSGKIDKIVLEGIDPYTLARELAKGVVNSVLQYERETRRGR